MRQIIFPKNIFSRKWKNIFASESHYAILNITLPEIMRESYLVKHKASFDEILDTNNEIRILSP